jgi:hypothetical protein
MEKNEKEWFVAGLSLATGIMALFMFFVIMAIL